MKCNKAYVPLHFTYNQSLFDLSTKQNMNKRIMAICEQTAFVRTIMKIPLFIRSIEPTNNNRTGTESMPNIILCFKRRPHTNKLHIIYQNIWCYVPRLVCVVICLIWHMDQIAVNGKFWFSGRNWLDNKVINNYVYIIQKN